MKKILTSASTFMGVLRGCLQQAWQDSDCHYNIPKSRFQDIDYNETAYRSSTGPGPFRRVGGFLSTVSHCISMAWEASDTFYNLPKRSYRNADFVRELMHLSPEPEGKLLYRPYTIGRGVVVCEGTGKGWSVEPPEEKPERMSDFIIPPGAPGPGGKLELEM